MLSTRKKRPLDRSEATRDAKLIIIAVEGEKTEEIYFTIFHSVKVKLRVISSSGGRSAPKWIMENMQSYIDTFEVGPEDQLWLAIDRDRWKPKSMGTVARLCAQKRINMAVSNPCFELWLAHHFDAALPQEINCKTLEGHLKEILGGYNKANYDPNLFLPLVNRAIASAKSVDVNLSSRWPEPVGSRIYQLVEEILNV